MGQSQSGEEFSAFDSEPKSLDEWWSNWLQLKHALAQHPDNQQLQDFDAAFPPQDAPREVRTLVNMDRYLSTVQCLEETDRTTYLSLLSESLHMQEHGDMEDAKWKILLEQVVRHTKQVFERCPREEDKRVVMQVIRQMLVHCAAGSPERSRTCTQVYDSIGRTYLRGYDYVARIGPTLEERYVQLHRVQAPPDAFSIMHQMGLIETALSSLQRIYRKYPSLDDAVAATQKLQAEILHEFETAKPNRAPPRRPKTQRREEAYLL